MRIPIMIVGAFLSLYFGLWSLLATYSLLERWSSPGDPQLLDIFGAVALLGLIAAWLRVSLPRKFQTSRSLRVFVVVTLIPGVAGTAWLLINVFPAIQNPLSWMFGAAIGIGAFLIAATIGERPGPI